MQVFSKIADLQTYIHQQKAIGKQIGFVPTMGALHQGHLSLIEASKKQTDVTICSIFINPTQFDDATDFDKYPRTIATDKDLLLQHQTDVLFLPSVAEMYPNTMEAEECYDFGQLDKVLEGAHRAGHFEGVAQIVKRLLEAVQPHYLFMGQKDYQQFQIIRQLLIFMQSDIQLVMCPIIRETDGLAMSSRNVRLSPEEREKARHISRVLLEICQNRHQYANIVAAKQWAISDLEQMDDVRVDYFEVVDAQSLQSLDNWTDAPKKVACTAVRVGAIRLIDNMFCN